MSAPSNSDWTMIELVYPAAGYAPMIPAITMEDRMKIIRSDAAKTPREETFPIVEPTGLVVGMATRRYCHSGAKPLHPVVHLHILDRMGRLYLQKRADDKDIQPGRWDTAVGGHVSYGESIIDALFRESSEELDFTEYNPVHLCTYVFESPIEKELVNVFVAIGSGFVLEPDGKEISEGRFWSEAELDAHIGDGTFTPNFESEFASIRKSLYALL